MLPILFSLFLAASPDTQTCSVSGVITHYSVKYPIYLALFASQADLDNHRPAYRQRFMVPNLPPDSLRFQFTGVKPGDYMAVAFQDMDGDRDIKVGLFGPTEPFRVYRPYKGLFGPKFKDCKFRVDRNVTDANIRF